MLWIWFITVWLAGRCLQHTSWVASIPVPSSLQYHYPLVQRSSWLEDKTQCSFQLWNLMIIWCLLSGQLSESFWLPTTHRKIPLKEQLKPVTKLIKRLPNAQAIFHGELFGFQKNCTAKSGFRWAIKHDFQAACTCCEGREKKPLTGHLPLERIENHIDSEYHQLLGFLPSDLS